VVEPDVRSGTSWQWPCRSVLVIISLAFVDLKLTSHYCNNKPFSKYLRFKRNMCTIREMALHLEALTLVWEARP
jgi:hypothetical protein